MKKILLLGSRGQVGWELERSLVPLGQILAFSREELDLSKPDEIRKIIREVAPHVIVNASAYTKVDQAETEQTQAMAINGITPGILAEEAKRLNAILIHYSTDYVFDGEKTTAYLEEDLPRPLNYYGESKWAGEKAIQAIGGKYMIIRTSWVFSMKRKNFLLTLLKLASEKQELKVVNDQFGSPTWSRWIAEATLQLLTLAHENWGLYHLTAAGRTSRYEFAQAIFNLYKQKNPSFQIPQLVAISSSEHILPAARPKETLLSNEKIQRTYGIFLPSWKEGLRLCLDTCC